MSVAGSLAAVSVRYKIQAMDRAKTPYQPVMV
jgi:hypothetical protein